MNKVFTVAAREFKAAVLTKAFLVTLAVMPIMMGGSLLIQFLVKDMKSTKVKKFVIIDRTPKKELYQELVKVVNIRNAMIEKSEADAEKVKDAADEESGKKKMVVKGSKFSLEEEAPSADTTEAILKQRYDLAERIRKQEIFGFLDVGKNVLKTPVLDAKFLSEHGASITAGMELGRDKDKVKAAQLSEDQVIRYYSNSPTYNDFMGLCKEVLNRSIIPRVRSDAQKIPPNTVMSITTEVPMVNKDLPKLNRLTGQLEDGKDVNPIVSFLIPFGIVMIMFMIIMVGATPLMQGVVEEKMQRISELLLSSAQPFQLMLGKLLGGVAVSLMLGTVYLAGAYLAAWQYGFTDYLTPTVIIWFLVYLCLAVLMFGSLFVAVGAACTEIKETQSLLMPIMLLATFPLFFLTNLITEPDGKIATTLSFIPFATPSMMVARLAIPPGAAWWHPWVGVVIVLLTTLLCVWIASRIFRVGLLMQGKGASFGEMMKWVWTG